MTIRFELTLPALERLLGGETDAEVKLRQQVVDAFAKKHLKPLVDKTTMGTVQKELLKAVEAYCLELFGQWNHGESSTIQDNSHYGRIVKRVDDLIDRHIKEQVDLVIGRHLATVLQTLPATVERAVHEGVASEVEKEIGRRLTLAREMR